MYETLIRVILVMGDDRYRHGCCGCLCGLCCADITFLLSFVCASRICKAAKKKLSRKVIAVVAAAAFAGAVLAVILIARTPMPL